MASTTASRSATRRFRRLACLLGAGVVAFTVAQTATATTPVGTQVRATVTGPDGDTNYGVDGVAAARDGRTGNQLLVWRRVANSPKARIYGRFLDPQGQPAGAEFPISDAGFDAGSPTVAWNPRANEFMVAFERETAVAGEYEIYVQRLAGDGTERGTDTRITTAGNGTPAFDAGDPAIVVNEARNEYLVAYESDDNAGAFVDDELEVHIQRLAADGTQLGTDDQRVSSAGPTGNANFAAEDVSAAWDERHDEYLLAWEADDAAGPYVVNEREIRVQRVTGDGVEIGTDDQRISDVGPPGDADYDATDPSVAYNAAADEFMVTWDGDDNAAPLVKDETEIFAQRLSWDGVEQGIDDQRISDMGADGATTPGANGSNVSYDPRANEYLVAWHGDDTGNGHYEVYAQRLSASGAEVDGNDVRVSFMQDENANTAGAFDPAVTYDGAANQYQLAWTGASTVAPLAGNEFELYARRFGAGTPVVTTARLCKTLPALTDPPKGDPSKITLSVDQLIINQRIDQAAIRRANGVQAWIDAGVEARDLCQAALGADELYSGAAGGWTGVPATYGEPNPRPVDIPAAKPGDPSKVTLTVNQLLINQRISQAAIRRLNALKARLDAGLTGGDVKDGAVGRAQLLAGTTVVYAPVLTTPPAASVTTIAPASPGDPSKVTLSVNQLLINQRISQAAVKRANELIHRLGEGIGPEEIRDGGLTAADLAPGLALSTAP
ncbi:MAG: hypothetical protein U0237_18130 [Thermoleophilia bacterium]